MTTDLKLFVWEKVLCDYTCGLVCVLAHDLEEAHTLIKTKYESYYDESLPPLPTSVVEEPAAFAVYGGG